MRVLVCGGRNYDDVVRVHRTMQQLPTDATVVVGGARGADTLAEHSALSLGLAVETYYANWDLHGKRAGPIRNQEMLDSGVDYGIAFDGGRGTQDMVNRLLKAGVTVYFPDITPVQRSDFE